MSKKKSEKLDPHSPFAKLQLLKAELENAEKAALEAKAKQTLNHKSTAHNAAKHGHSSVALRKPGAELGGSRGPISSLPDDSLTFARMMMGVVPLQSGVNRVTAGAGQEPHDPRARVQPSDRKAELDAQLLAEQVAVQAHMRDLAQGATRFEVQDDGRNLEGRRVDCNPLYLRKLRRGQFPLDGRVDLHGMHAHDAKAALYTFLRKMRDQRELCVLIIHGKGEHSPGGQGILRGELAAWLSQGQAAEHVAAFASAQESDGGHGATYVLLRR
jgi:DNA-nicking Smr family endonuclease